MVFSGIFFEDVDASHKYIKEVLEAPRAAEDLKNELLEKLDYLKENPYSRPLVHDEFLASLGVRSIKVKTHLIFYGIECNGGDDKLVNIFRFMYSKRNWMSILREKPLRYSNSSGLAPKPVRP